MQVVIVATLLTVANVVAGGQVTTWPGGAQLSLSQLSPVLRAFPALPASRAVSYSTTQYIGNPSPLTYYQLPQPVRAISPLHASYYPLAAPSYFPSAAPSYYPSAGPSYFPSAGPSYFPTAGAVYYPTAVAPILQQDSIASLPGANYPTQPTEQPAGDTDTAVIDSAEFPDQSSESSFESDAATPAPPQMAPSFPGFPQFPSIPQLPQLPSFPSFPQFPQAPSTPPPSQPEQGFPSSNREDKGLNDEDTVSVESA